MASQIWSRVSTLGRDSMTLSRAFAQALSPILRRQDTQSSVGDAFRSVIVTQARQSNRVATNLLTLQQQIGLIQYHGVMEYWRQRQGLLQSSNFSVAADSGSAITSPGDDDSNGNVAKVAFMITASMRKELSERLGYNADDIKSMTPTEASLILNNDVKPEQKDEQLPALLEAHEAELEKQREEQARLEDEKKLKEAQLADEKKLKEAEQKDKEKADALATAETPAPNPTPDPDNKLQPAIPVADSTAPKDHEYKLENAPQVPVDELALGAAIAPETSSRAVVYDPTVLGSFATSMEARVDEKQEWYEVVETRGDTSAPVLLFSSKEEAEKTMELKRTFAERRAHEDPENHENIPATTYYIQKTIK